jgi:hypothetical protein
MQSLFAFLNELADDWADSHSPRRQAADPDSILMFYDAGQQGYRDQKVMVTLGLIGLHAFLSFVQSGEWCRFEREEQVTFGSQGRQFEILRKGSIAHSTTRANWNSEMAGIGRTNTGEIRIEMIIDLPLIQQFLV